MPFRITSGESIPYGATYHSKGVNFAVFVENSSPVELILMHPETQEVWESIPIPFQTGEVRHLLVEDLKPPFAYAFKTSLGGNARILDPYAKAILSPSTWNAPGSYSPVGLVLEPSDYDWGNDRPPGIAKEDLILYEMHIRGFTKHASSGVKNPGTFLGVIEKIPHLKKLGVNAIEIMPLQEFNEKEYTPLNPIYQGKLFQYWGYSTVQFFCPMNRYATVDLQAAKEFKDMVKALHANGIEVIIDMVLNHTAEGNEKGVIQTFKGLAPNIYYIHTSKGEFANFSGCGNTLNCNEPVVIEFILNVLRYWVTEMRVDGFRFDLASIFYRGSNGEALSFPPVVEAITKDPTLSSTKLIAEPWDAAGLYKVGNFFPDNIRWSEWNGKYRDCMRKFIKGDQGIKGEFATRICGSEDLYGHHGRLPRNSINFITSHDGFTLRDLVSYNRKHNSNNGENNKDGMNDNDSWNCGEEGNTSNPDIIKLREKQMRNFHLALMISQGVPMLFMGDEYGHTKQGNNNSWCQDNPINWFLWDELKNQTAFMRFYMGLIQFRKKHPNLRHRKFLRDNDIQWHGKHPHEPAWELEDRLIAFTLLDKREGQDLYIAFNSSGEPVEVAIPKRQDEKAWVWIVNTARPSPLDFRDESERMRLVGLTFTLEAYSSVLLKAL